MKYNKKNSIYIPEFQKIKSIYDKLKLYIENQAKKVINEYKSKIQLNRNKKPKEQIRIENISPKKIIAKSVFNKLLIEKNINFYYVNILKKEKKLKNRIKKEISFYLINKIKVINIFNKDLSKIHEKELTIINQILKKEDNNKIKKLEKNNSDIDLENDANESEVDKEQLEFLLNENQELKNQIEEYKEKNNASNSNSKEDLETYYKETINENETKIKFLTEQNKFY